MKANDKEINEVLNECIDRILTQDETVDDCIKRYPDHATELGELLNTATAVKKLSRIKPSLEYRERVKVQCVSALREEKFRKTRNAGAFSIWRPKWSAIVGVIVGFALVGSGTVVAAAYSMPDESLYPVKLATEQAQLAFTFSKLERARLYTWFADRRVREIVKMASKGNAAKVAAVADRLDKDLQALTSLAPAKPSGTEARVAAPAATATGAVLPAPTDSLAGTGNYGGTQKSADSTGTGSKVQNSVAKIVVQYAMTHPETMRKMIENAPESAKPALRNAISRAAAAYQKALEAWDGDN